MKSLRSSFRAFLGLGLTLLVLSQPARAADPPRVGDVARDFTLKAVGGESVQLAEELKTGPVVLVVLRGYPGYQCPICNAQVAELSRAADSIKAVGARVLLVYPGPNDQIKARAQEFLKGKSLPDHFQLLLDPDFRFLETYHLRWKAAGETSYPSTFVIGKDSIIRFSKVSQTHGGRARASEVLQALSKTKP